MKSRFFLTLAAAVIGVASAQAGVIDVVLDNPDQTGAVGQELQFFGTLTNTGTDTIFLNQDTVNLAGLPSDFDVSDLVGVPLSLDPGQSSGDIELFDVTIDPSFADSFGTYAGTYGLLGGVDDSAAVVLVDPVSSFSVTATPEPGTWALLLGGFAVAGAYTRRRLLR